MVFVFLQGWMEAFLKGKCCFEVLKFLDTLKISLILSGQTTSLKDRLRLDRSIADNRQTFDKEVVMGFSILIIVPRESNDL